MPPPRRFTPPWTIDEQTESFTVRDAHVAKFHQRAVIADEPFPLFVTLNTDAESRLGFCGVAM